MQKEAKARIKINNLLQESGWRFFDDENGKANIVLDHIIIGDNNYFSFADEGMIEG